MRRTLPLLLLFLLPLVGCEDEAESAAAAAPAIYAQRLNPWDSIPPDSLYGATPVENLRVTPVELDLLGIPPGWEGLRIAAISDLNLGLWEGNEEVAAAAVRRAAAAGADLVVLLGDYAAAERDTAALARVLAPLRGRPAVAVLGDRDIRSDSLEAAITRTLSAQGIQVLKSGAVPFVHNGDTALVAGVSAKLMGEPVGDQKWVLGQLGGEGRRGLLLSHSPTLAALAPEGRFPGALAGHTFCGRVEVPGTPRLSWLNTQGLPGAVVPEVERLYRIDDMVMFVTCGVGYGFVPVRFGAPPEVALVTLHPVAAAGARQPGEDTVSIDTLIEQFQRRDTTAEGDTGR